MDDCLTIFVVGLLIASAAVGSMYGTVYGFLCVGIGIMAVAGTIALLKYLSPEE